jgi:adenylate cyclase
MEKVEQKRQLAAIMFTDIVGYTALMGESEENALHVRRINREIHQQKIEDVGGTWLKEMGDGTLASFTTVTEAVEAAIEIRKICREELDIELKIGIHLGEVIHEDNDVFGDGVNIASRIEALAVGGGILISEPVFNEITNKEGLEAAFIGHAMLKNVDKPVNIYQILVDGLTKPTIKIKCDGKRNKLFGISAVVIVALLAVAYFFIWPRVFYQPVPYRSIAVIPFNDLSETGDQQFFADGVMEDILGQLQRIEELHVVSRTSVMKYRGRTPTIKEIQKDLKVDYVLEGSVRKSPTEIMITAQLIDVNEDKHLSSENYISKYSAQGIFSIQDRIAKRIVNDLKLTISPEKVIEITRPLTESTLAYEYFQAGRRQSYKGYIGGYDSAIIELKKAISVDTTFAAAYGLIASTIG